MKKVTAVSPYLYPSGCNFKYSAYLAWRKIGGTTCTGSYPYRRLHGLFFKYDLIPTLCQQADVRLCFAQPDYLTFDACHSVLCHEIIPFLWDCWPKSDELLVRWLVRHKVKSCIITSSEAVNRIKKILPNLNVFFIPEGIDISKYEAGKRLVDRYYDVYYYGRQKMFAYEEKNHKNLNVIYDGNDDEFFSRLQDSKVTVAVPRCDVVPQYEHTNGQETLTQRYWECMLSRMVMVGRSPKELIDLIGYDPVIPIDYNNYASQIKEIVDNIDNYQDLVNKNRDTALRMAPWEIRMKQVIKWLEGIGYVCT